MNPDLLVDNILSKNLRLREKAFLFIYRKCYPKVKQYVLKNSGNVEAAEDVFQEAISITYFNLLENKFRGDSSLVHYVIGIARNLWLHKLRKKTLPTSPIEGNELSENDDPGQIDISLLNYILAKLNHGCRQILKNFYFNEMSMEEVAKNSNLGSAQAAKTKKLRCMKKLTTLIEEHGLKNHDFRL
ncbi:RNA polymerase sigma factor [Roseivirga echinicomitans]|uniref:RNA polymerase sigma-70 region 2 domain-containing protein n=1 Tax=Roseivirga echinicomitans TaxID=296218 RepID=A0A150XLP9_9BACT|nr:sigma-70 family RNA polymerase sigma factor [Roseivirga echinicomitans]KYG79640.1 hypothetical protein AWN68_17710 [Roseivirga echinicomitans]